MLRNDEEALYDTFPVCPGFDDYILGGSQIAGDVSGNGFAGYSGRDR